MSAIHAHALTTMATKRLAGEALTEVYKWLNAEIARKANSGQFRLATTYASETLEALTDDQIVIVCFELAKMLNDKGYSDVECNIHRNSINISIYW